MLDKSPAMPTRTVVLTNHQEKLIDKLVGSSRYQHASEVLRDGLRLVEQREAERAAKAEGLAEGGERVTEFLGTMTSNGNNYLLRCIELRCCAPR
jgi:putative addiction module CopG family antidote